MSAAVRNILCQLLLCEETGLPAMAKDISPRTLGAMITAGLVRPVGVDAVAVKLTAKGEGYLRILHDIGDSLVAHTYDTIDASRSAGSADSSCIGDTH